MENGTWTYKGVNVYPAARNGSGMRWCTVGPTLRSDTKAGMRELITLTQGGERVPAAKPRLAILWSLIDGAGRKRFASIAKAAAYVARQEDLGEDGRRVDGFQAEFGYYSFVGFTWSEIRAEWARVELEAIARRFEVLDMSHSGYLCDYGRECYSRAWSVLLGAESFLVRATPGRFMLSVEQWDDSDPEAGGLLVDLGRYQSIELAIGAARRWMAGPVGDLMAARWLPAPVLASLSDSEIPF